ncbi:hypothetical protein CBR_g18898 [Chara braunii]|uniref:Uncharacterized protein n=1 Tax=Chara braunii TaxID=69332 RepID=A0A388KWV2_CHABU|nr:hypothetical protein CBR_g18898 [Chara braunii]|eukprot:GBG74488.1 hypothetical protein CBR_g18898 [Chara braunii]
MRTDVERDDGGDTSAHGEDVAEEFCTDDDDESEEDDEAAAKEMTSKGRKKKASKSCGRSKVREEQEGADAEGGGHWGRDHAPEMAFGRIARPRPVQKGPRRSYGEPRQELRTYEDEDRETERDSEADGPAGGYE